MTFPTFQQFEPSPFPCYFLTLEGEFLSNMAAQETDPALDIAAQTEQILRLAALRSHSEQDARPFTSAFPDGALRTSTLLVLPLADGLLGVVSKYETPPISAFSSQMRDSLTNVFAILPLLAKRLNDEDQKYLDEIQHNCYTLLRVSCNMETVGRILNHSYTAQPLDLTALLSSLCTSIASVAAPCVPPLQMDLPSLPLPVNGNAQVLSEAILNILRNSIQYSRDGNEISVKLAKKNGHAVLTIKDRGMGFRSEHLPYVFDPYFSADPYGEEAGLPGLGMGLYIAQEVVRSAGGTLTLESRFGEGTSVTISLPLAQNDPATLLHSDTADYLLNRFSPVYVHLCDFCHLPHA